MEKKVTYFEKPGGEENTSATLALAKERAAELGIYTIVVASTVGDTAVKAVNVFEGFRVIIVTHVAGFREPNVQEFTEANRVAVVAKGGIIHTAAHSLGGIHRALSRSDGPFVPQAVIGDIAALTLRTFGQGTKVALEIATMAADAGLVRTDEEIICIGGTGRGADTALVIQPNYTHRFFNIRVKEIICKPRL
jgi:hypothetical protein